MLLPASRVPCGCAVWKLANKSLKLVNRMIQTGQPYDDQR
jgi:hypothetical protein